MSELRPLSVLTSRARPDGRSSAGRIQKATRIALTDQLGGPDRISSYQEILIDRAAVLQWQIYETDRKRVAGTLTEREEAENGERLTAFFRVLHRLGLDRATAEVEEEPDPIEAINLHLARKRALAESA